MAGSWRIVTRAKMELATAHGCGYPYDSGVRAWGAAAALAVALGAAAAASGQGVDETCVLPLTKTDAATVNLAFPDEAATYWIAPYQAAPGLRVRITGEFPHARYMSFNAYDAAQRPLDALADSDYVPGARSVNPFVTGADRGASRRRYTGFVDFGPLPARRAPNTLYTGTGQNGTPNEQGTLIYRVYTPDRGRDATGGAGLPTITLEQASNGRPPPRSVCAGLSKPAVPGVNQQVAQSNGVAALDSAQPFGPSPPTWRKFVNLPQAAADFGFGNPTGEAARPLFDPLIAHGGNGGFLSNLHNAYLATVINRRYGQVVETSFRAPTFPDTRPGTSPMPGGQLRYFSMCENEFFSQRYVACRQDDQSALDRAGLVHYVVSTPAERPSNATARCGYTWLPWGPDAEGVLIYRNMLASPSFAQSIQRATYGREAQTMGAYYPRSRYFADRAAFEKTGCAAAPPRRRNHARRSQRLSA
jgi:hypothetical protein